MERKVKGQILYHAIKEGDIVLRTTDGAYCKYAHDYEDDSQRYYCFRFQNNQGFFLVPNYLMMRMFKSGGEGKLEIYL